jgi:hypothetical protein
MLANRATRVTPDNAIYYLHESGRKLSGTSLDVMDNVGCPYGTLGLEGKPQQVTSTYLILQEICMAETGSVAPQNDAPVLAGGLRLFPTLIDHIARLMIAERFAFCRNRAFVG